MKLNLKELKPLVESKNEKELMIDLLVIEHIKNEMNKDIDKYSQIRKEETSKIINRIIKGQKTRYINQGNRIEWKFEKKNKKKGAKK